jgi:hypothetical protein
MQGGSRPQAGAADGVRVSQRALADPSLRDLIRPTRTNNIPFALSVAREAGEVEVHVL